MLSWDVFVWEFVSLRKGIKAIMKKYICFLFVMLGLGIARAHVSFESSVAPKGVKEDKAAENQTFGKYIHRIKPQGYLYGGMIVNDWYIGPTLDFTYGVRCYDYFFWGLELGYSCWIAGDDNRPYRENWYVLNFASFRMNMRGYWPVTEKFTPFINLSVGTSVALSLAACFNMQLGAGVEIRRFTVDMGYNLLPLYGDIHSCYLRLGIRL